MPGTFEAPRVLDGDDAAKVEAARTAARARFADLAADDDASDVPGPVDPDNPPMTDEQLARLRPAAEIVPGLVAASLRRQGGRPRSIAPKVPVSIRLDPDVLSLLRASGSGWQSRANDMLRKGLGLDGSANAGGSTEEFERTPRVVERDHPGEAVV